MGEKDITQKMLENEPDVFADICNALIFTDEEDKISEDFLSDIPTEGFVPDISGEVRNVFMDIAKKYHEEGKEECIAIINIENETAVKRIVPLKCFRYKCANLSHQYFEYDSERRALLSLRKAAIKDGNDILKKAFDESLEKLGEFRIVPFITIVLNFSDKKWDGPKDLAELDIDSKYTKYDQPFKIKVFDMKFLKREQIELFKSDFRIFLELFCENSLPEELKRTGVRHTEELLRMLRAFLPQDNDRLTGIYDEIASSHDDEEEDLHMITIFNDIYDKGVADGEKNSKEAAERAAERTVLNMYKNGIAVDMIAKIIEKDTAYVEAVIAKG